MAAHDDTSGHARAHLSAFSGTRRWNLERRGPVDAGIGFWDSSGPAAAKTLPVGLHPCPYRANRNRSDYGTGSSRASRPFRLCDASASAKRLVVPAAILLAAWGRPSCISLFGLHLLPFNGHQADKISAIEPGGACLHQLPLHALVSGAEDFDRPLVEFSLIKAFDCPVEGRAVIADRGKQGHR